MTVPYLRFTRAAILITLTLVLSSCRQADDEVYQLSFIESLMSGNYDGARTVADILPRGDFGIGTFDQLDGEMILLDGEMFQAKSDGTLVRPLPTLTSPYATVCWFKPTMVFSLNGIKDIEILSRVLSHALPGKDLIYAVQVSGSFDAVTFRSVARQEKPFKPLVKVVKGQAVFSLAKTSGTLVGFFCPEYLGRVSVAGLHLHFLDAGKKRGGHLLNLASSGEISCKVSVYTKMSLDLSGNQHQSTAANASVEADITEVER